MTTAVPPWGATTISVLQRTGKSVNDTDVSIAASIIESVTGLIGRDLSAWADRKIQILRRAVEYQTAYILENPEIFSIGVYQSLRADGVTQDFLRGDAVLAPAAIRTLNSLNRRAWIETTKSLRGGTGVVIGDPHVVESDLDPYEDGGNWIPADVL